MKDIGLVCIDFENCISPYKGDTVYEKYASIGPRMAERGVTLFGLTNMPEPERAGNIADQLGVDYAHKGMILPNGGVMPSKSHPEMYRYAIETVGFGSNGDKAMMIDDQLKNIRGAAKVPEFTSYVHTVPRGFFRSHPGVLAFRPFEYLICWAVGAFQHDDNAGVFPHFTYQPPVADLSS